MAQINQRIERLFQISTQLSSSRMELAFLRANGYPIDQTTYHENLRLRQALISLVDESQPARAELLAQPPAKSQGKARDEHAATT